MKFEFSKDEDYYFHTYTDEITYRRNQFQSQLDSALIRLKDEKSTTFLFGGISLLIIFMFLLGIFTGVTGGTAGMFSLEGATIGFIGSAITLISAISLLSIFPFSLYKAIYGYLIYCICEQNLVGVWLMEHTEVPDLNEEITACRQYVNKCDIVMRKIDKLREDYELGLPVDFSEVEADVRGIKLISDIPVQNVNTPKMKMLTKRISMIILVIIYIVAFISFKYALSNWYQGLVEMFRQI